MPQMPENMKLHYLYSTARGDLARKVMLKQPTTLDAAFSAALIEERVQLQLAQQPVEGSSKEGWTPLPLHMPPAPTTTTRETLSSTGVEPMDVDARRRNQPHTVNVQSTENRRPRPRARRRREKPSRVKGRCYNCDKIGHWARDCRRPKVRQQRVQQTQSSEDPALASSTHKPGSAVDYPLDATSYLDRLYNITTQMVLSSNQDSKPPRFSIPCMINNQNIDLLIDSGSDIDSACALTANKLGLLKERSEPIMINYGGKHLERSIGETAHADLVIDGKHYATTFHLVAGQQPDFIVGTSWIRHHQLLLDVCANRVLPRSWLPLKIHATEALHPAASRALSKYPVVYDRSPRQTITNAPVQHTIVTDNASPISVRDYRRSPKERAALSRIVDELLQQQVIQPSTSAWCSPPVLVKKNDGSYRLCINYKKLNSITRKDKYPLPRIDDLIERLHGARTFSTLDLKSGYWQIPMAPLDACKTAFKTDSGLYEFTVMPFGVTNGPATFQRFMDQILRPVSAFTMVYIDDIIIFSDNVDAHVQHLDRVLHELCRWNLRISLEKCTFFATEVRFLGFMVSASGIRADPTKVSAVKDWPRPTTAKGVQRFLGMCAFYHKFIRSLSTIAAPLYALTAKNCPFIWKDDEEEAFCRLKTCLTDIPALAYPNPNLPYEMHTDASYIGLGAVLVQETRPVAFASRTLTSAERNYHTTEKECLAVIWALRYFHPYIHGASLTIYTDHMALKAIMKLNAPKGRIARWILELDGYDFTIVHRRGKDNLDADALSRQFSNAQQQVPVHLNREVIQQHQRADPVLARRMDSLDDKHTIIDDTLYRWVDQHPVLVIPTTLRNFFLEQVHDHPTAAHMGRDKTLAKAKEHGWWPTLVQDTTDFVRRCVSCQLHKSIKHKFGQLSSIPVGKAGEVWAMDIAILPTVSMRGNKYILVAMEYLTKWVVSAALPQFTTPHVANVLLFSIVLTFGTPRRLITDNGTNFVSEAMHQVCLRLGISQSTTSVEHPQTDGLVERMNQTLKTALAPFAFKYPEHWDEFLPFVTFGINTSKQASTGFTPFELMFGRKPTLPTTGVMEPPTLQSHNAKTWAAYLNHYLPVIHDKARERIIAAQKRQARYYDRHRLPERHYNIGDQVLKIIPLEARHFPRPKFTGPWSITAITKQGSSYHLEMKMEPKNRIKRTTANHSQLEPFYE